MKGVRKWGGRTYGIDEPGEDPHPNRAASGGHGGDAAPLVATVHRHVQSLQPNSKPGQANIVAIWSDLI